MVKHPIYCYACKQTHELTVAELERLLYTLQAAEQTAGMDPADGRDIDSWDCLRDTWLCLSHDVEGYAEHLEQAVGLRRDLAGARPGDEDLCACGELIQFVELAAAGPRTTIRRWEHIDPAAWELCRTAGPDDGRQP
jgi:hypothetical protein